ncbi:toll/interleukin-1 receptor domain-containing protein [Nocardia sp. NRRL S-836]|uniref:toll/interleukin-1 receptor domain-containing protein n=1 Tax=Nocardia sp. NRRL S-836 TaxID=1519492 RepID=UPI0006AF1149|nr:toll/interleukin-1 receptor domain-containing protein [Nocardia sp. NRRL S-836]
MHSAGPRDGSSWDFFISHASEDKRLVAGPLAHYLRSAGFSVWYDDFTLRVGDSVLREIDRGLGSSRYGVVVLSEAFFAKQWPRRELAGLMAAANGERRVLPVWHGVDAADVAGYSPMLADVKGVSTVEGLHVVAEELVRAAFPHRVAGMPITNTGWDRRGEDLAHGQEVLRAVLERGGGPADVRQVVSDCPLLVARWSPFGTRIVPVAGLADEVPVDFVLISDYGRTRGSRVTLVAFGPVGPGGAGAVAVLDQALGERLPHSGLSSSSVCGVADFPKVYAAMHRVAALLEVDGSLPRAVGEGRLSVLFVHGRRGAQDDLSAVPTRVPVEAASYDRLLDRA